MWRSRNVLLRNKLPSCSAAHRLRDNWRFVGSLKDEEMSRVVGLICLCLSLYFRRIICLKKLLQMEVPDIPQEKKIFSNLILVTNQTRSDNRSNSKSTGIHSLFHCQKR
jgi:hypothetical protein